MICEHPYVCRERHMVFENEYYLERMKVCEDMYLSLLSDLKAQAVVDVFNERAWGGFLLTFKKLSSSNRCGTRLLNIFGGFLLLRVERHPMHQIRDCYYLYDPPKKRLYYCKFFQDLSASNGSELAVISERGDHFWSTVGEILGSDGVDAIRRSVMSTSGRLLECIPPEIGAELRPIIGFDLSENEKFNYRQRWFFYKQVFRIDPNDWTQFSGECSIGFMGDGGVKHVQRIRLS